MTQLTKMFWFSLWRQLLKQNCCMPWMSTCKYIFYFDTDSFEVLSGANGTKKWEKGCTAGVRLERRSTKEYKNMGGWQYFTFRPTWDFKWKSNFYVMFTLFM